MLVAIMLYGFAASSMEYLGAFGFINEVTYLGRYDEHLRIVHALDIIKPGEELLNLIGGVVAAGLVLRVSPFRAFFRLNCVIAVFGVTYLILKFADGFTVGSVLGLYCGKALLNGAQWVVYATAAAALTSRPNTAGQYSLIAFLVIVPWLPTATYEHLIGMGGGYLLPTVAVAAAFGAVMLLQLSAWMSRRRRAEAAAKPSG